MIVVIAMALTSCTANKPKFSKGDCVTYSWTLDELAEEKEAWEPLNKQLALRDYYYINNVGKNKYQAIKVNSLTYNAYISLEFSKYLVKVNCHKKIIERVNNTHREKVEWY